MKVKTRIVLDLNRPGVEPVVYAKQWDKLSRYIEVSLYAGSAAFTPPAGATYEVRGVKPDNTVLKYSKDEAGAAAVTVSGHTATITLAQQALACPGDVKMELAIKSGEETLTSFRFTLRVEQSALADVSSNNYVNPALATFIPSVSNDGVISWTNDGGLTNPTPRNIRGPSGAKIVSTVKIGEDTDGGYKYRQTFDDGQTTEFTAPRGPAGTGNVSSVAGIEPDSDGNVPLTVDADLIEAGAVGTAKLTDNAVTGAKIADGAVTRDKLAKDSLYSPTTNFNSNRAIALSDLGQTLWPQWSAAGATYTLSLTADVSEALPVGFEVAIAYVISNCKVQLSISGVRMVHMGDGQLAGKNETKTLTISEIGGMLALKKFDGSSTAGDLWILTGPMEVVT